MNQMIRLLAALLLVSSVAGPAAAQGDSCAAVTFDSHSKLPPASANEWNAWRLCNQMNVFAAALASPQVFSEVDSDRLNVLFTVHAGRPDGALFSAYTGAVLNGVASEPFRIEAMRALGGLVFPSLDIGITLSTPTQPVCRVGARRLAEADGSPSTLPADAFARATSTFASVAASSASSRVRFAAKCWEGLLDRHTPVDVDKISVSYVCGNKFRVTNGNRRGLALNFSVSNKGDVGEFSVPKSGEYMLNVATSGVVSVYEGAKIVASATNGGVGCK